MMEPKLALMTAPMPIDDWAEMEATAIPARKSGAQPRGRQKEGETQLTDKVRERDHTEQSDDEDEGLTGKQMQERTDVVLLDVRNQDEEVEDRDRDEGRQVDEPDVDSVDRVLVVLESGGAVRAEEHRGMRTAESAFAAIGCDRLGRSRRGRLTDSERVDHARRRIVRRVVGVNVWRLDIKGEVLGNRLVVGRRPEVDRQRLVVKVSQQDPEQLGHRDCEDERPAGCGDEEEGRGDDSVEEDPVHDASESTHAPAVHLRVFAEVVRRDAALQRSLDGLLARSPALILSCTVIASGHRSEQVRRLAANAKHGRITCRRPQCAIAPPQRCLFRAVGPRRAERLLVASIAGLLLLVIIVASDILHPAFDVFAKRPSQVRAELPDNSAVLRASERSDEQDGGDQTTKDEERRAEYERPDNVGREEMVQSDGRWSGVHCLFRSAGDRAGLFVQGRFPDRQPERMFDVDCLQKMPSVLGCIDGADAQTHILSVLERVFHLAVLVVAVRRRMRPIGPAISPVLHPRLFVSRMLVVLLDDAPSVPGTFGIASSAARARSARYERCAAITDRGTRYMRVSRMMNMRQR